MMPIKHIYQPPSFNFPYNHSHFFICLEHYQHGKFGDGLAALHEFTTEVMEYNCLDYDDAYLLVANCIAQSQLEAIEDAQAVVRALFSRLANGYVKAKRKAAVKSYKGLRQ